MPSLLPTLPIFSLRRACLALALSLSLVACGEGKKEQAASARAQQRPAPAVTVMTVAPQDIPFTPSFVAQTESSQQVNIVARVSGFLDKIAYEEGELVKTGQVLFQLDPKPFQAQVEAARGEVQSQQARLTTAQANLGRVKPLAAENALSQSDLDRAQGEFDAAKAALFSAQAKLTEAQLNLGYTTIRSPVNGLASRSLQRQGSFVNAMSESANLTYVAAVQPIWVNFSVSQNQAAKWREEAQQKRLIRPQNDDYEVDIVLSDGTQYPYRGKINFADPSFSQDTGSFLVRAVLPNPKMELRPGMFVTAYVKGAIRPNAVVVPQLAVQQGSNGHFVYVVKPDDTAEVRPVVVGDYDGEKDIVINQGLVAGDRVVVDGVLKVVPGQPVKVAQAQGSSASASGSTPPPAAPQSGATGGTTGGPGQGTSASGAPQRAATDSGPPGSAQSAVPSGPASGALQGRSSMGTPQSDSAAAATAAPHGRSAAPPGGQAPGTPRNGSAAASTATPRGSESRSAIAALTSPGAAGATPAPIAPSGQGSPSPPAAYAPIAAGSYGPVRAGETLLEIAGRARPQEITLDQTLVGIYRANAHAFTPDHHRLKKGVMLAIPGLEELAAIDARDAAREVRAAREKWAAEHGGAK